MSSLQWFSLESHVSTHIEKAIIRAKHFAFLVHFLENMLRLVVMDLRAMLTTTMPLDVLSGIGHFNIEIIPNFPVYSCMIDDGPVVRHIS